ncbi:MAG: SAM-dependent methyltransferase [Chloroflexota bacterium]
MSTNPFQRPPTGAAIEAARRIRAHRPLTFADFMAIALYWPEGGTYAGPAPIGAGGDFTTAPHTHPAFGALVGRWLAAAWAALGRPASFAVREPGAGTGRLGLDVLTAARSLGAGFAEALNYEGVDVRPGPPGLGWRVADTLAPEALTGAIVANELLDAQPVHRVTVRDGVLRELYVGLDAEGLFMEQEGELSSPALARRLEALGVRLGEGHRAEVNLSLDAWFAQVSAALDRGYLLLVDYGHEAPAYYAPERARGTLRCYAGHTLNMDPYRDVGRQDISVHVEWTSVRRSAQVAGFAHQGGVSQAAFLRALGLDALRLETARRPDLPGVARAANLRGLEALIDEAGMGGFTVHVFAKDAPVLEAGLAGEPRGVPLPHAPVAGPGHTAYSPPEPELPSWDELMN